MGTQKIKFIYLPNHQYTKGFETTFHRYRYRGCIKTKHTLEFVRKSENIWIYDIDCKDSKEKYFCQSRIFIKTRYIEYLAHGMSTKSNVAYHTLNSGRFLD